MRTALANRLAKLETRSKRGLSDWTDEELAAAIDPRLAELIAAHGSLDAAAEHYTGDGTPEGAALARLLRWWEDVDAPSRGAA